MTRVPPLPRPLIESVFEGNAVLFIGAGFSHGVTGLDWWGLLDRLKEKLPDTSGWDSLDALDRAQLFVQAHGRDGLERELAWLLPTLDSLRGQVTDFHRTLVSLPFRVIVTTNYDALVEATLADLDQSYRVVVDDDEVARAASIRDGCRLVVKMHGDLLLGDTIVLTREDYLNYESSRPAMVTLFESLLLNHAFVFYGFGLSDPNFLLLYQSVLRKNAHARTAYAFMKEPNRLLSKFWSNRKVELISGRTFGELETMVVHLAQAVKSRRADEWDLDSVLDIHFPDEHAQVTALLDEVRGRFCQRLADLEPFLWVRLPPDEIEHYSDDEADDVLGAFRVLRALALGGFPVDPEYFARAAELLVRFGMNEAARAALEMTLRIMHRGGPPASPQLRSSLGRVLCRLGEFDRAMVFLERALAEADPDEIWGRMAELAWLSRCILDRIDRLSARGRDRAVMELVASFLRNQASRIEQARNPPPEDDEPSRWSAYYVNYRVGRIMALASELAGTSSQVYAETAVDMLARAIELAPHKPDPYRAIRPLLTEPRYPTEDAQRWVKLVAHAPPALLRRLIKD